MEHWKLAMRPEYGKIRKSPYFVHSSVCDLWLVLVPGPFQRHRIWSCLLSLKCLEWYFSWRKSRPVETCNCMIIFFTNIYSKLLMNIVSIAQVFKIKTHLFNRPLDQDSLKVNSCIFPFCIHSSYHSACVDVWSASYLVYSITTQLLGWCNWFL